MKASGVTVSTIYCFYPKLRLCFVRNWVLLYINEKANRCALLSRYRPLQQTSEHTKPQSNKDTDTLKPQPYELSLQNSSINKPQSCLHTHSTHCMQIISRHAFSLRFWLKWNKIFQDFALLASRRLSLRHVFSAICRELCYLAKTISLFQDAFNAS